MRMGFMRPWYCNRGGRALRGAHAAHPGSTTGPRCEQVEHVLDLGKSRSASMMWRLGCEAHACSIRASGRRASSTASVGRPSAGTQAARGVLGWITVS